MQRGYYWDNPDSPKIIKKEPDKELEFFSLPNKRNYRNTPIETKSLAASTPNNLITVLNKNQLLQCGNAYINNGIVRTVIDKTVYFINGERSSFVIEPNDELTEGLDDKETRELRDKIQNSPENLELRRKLVRYNKRTEFNDRCAKLLTSTLIAGRGALEIKTLDVEGSKQPFSLKHLNSLRIKEAKQDSNGNFTGFEYEEQIGKTRFISSQNMIAAFHDDNNILDNSNYSGLSAVWPILEAANTIEAIISEDMPEAARQLHAKFGIMYAGTSKKSTLRKLREELEASTWLVHNEEGLTAEVHDLARDPMELMNVTESLAKYICMSTSLPMFLLFEDTANFATANQVMQVYKAGMLKRYRTWFQGILEKHWYDPILADHLGIELKDVISADIKIKAIFPDINFETRKEILEGDQIAVNIGTLNKIDVAKDIGREDIIPRLEQEMEAEQEEEQMINDSIQRQREESIKGQQIANKQGKPAKVPFPKSNE